MTTYLTFKNDKKANAFAQAWAKKAKAGDITKVTKKGLITLVITHVDFLLLSWIKDNYKH